MSTEEEERLVVVVVIVAEGYSRTAPQHPLYRSLSSVIDDRGVGSSDIRMNPSVTVKT